MRHFLKHFTAKWRHLLAERKFRWSLFAAVALMMLALYINYRAVFYTDQIPVLAVGDIILDNIPTVDLSFMYTYVGSYFVMLFIIFYPLLIRPELIPFTGKTSAVFIITRAFFMTLTHLGAPENYFRLPGLEDQPGVSKFFYANDLFFSGHVGFPFLGALLFWESKPVRYFLLLMSGAQAVTVLFMHLHYSIDVFAAYFITYTIYIVSDRLFNKLNLHFREIVKKVISAVP